MKEHALVDGRGSTRSEAGSMGVIAGLMAQITRRRDENIFL